MLNKKSLVFLTVIFFLVAQLPLFSKANSVCNETIKNSESSVFFVGGNNTGNYTKIQDAIDDATDGDKIFVFSGVYYENIVIDKSISLQGENKDNTFIDGGKTIDVIRVIKDNVTINNFTICNSGPTINDAGIELNSDDCLIQNIFLFNVSYGIWIKNGKNNVIKNNSINALWDGIWLFKSGYNIMKNNYLFDCGFVLDGSELSDFLQDIDTSNTANNKTVYYIKNKQYVKIQQDAGQVIIVNCSNCEISNLKISNVTDCIEVIYSDNNTIINNSLYNSTDHGIRMFESNNNIIKNNIIYNNPVGISFSGVTYLGDEYFNFREANIVGNCTNNLIFNNKIMNNFHRGICLITSNDNLICKNVFIENRMSAYFENCKNIWSNNYWNRPRLFPKLIFGIKSMGKINIPLINIDFSPATKEC